MTKVEWHKFELMSDQETGEQYLISDEYPDEGQRVLLCIDNYVFIGTFYHEDNGGIFMDKDSIQEIDDMWYWAELPEPPEEENDQQKDRSQT